MYRRILVAVENSAGGSDDPRRTSRQLAQLTGAELLLVHVADGWAARNFDELKLRESEEMQDDRAYLETLQQRAPSGQGLAGRPRSSRWATRRPS